MGSIKRYTELKKSDEILLATTRGIQYPLDRNVRKEPEQKIARTFRFCQVNKDNIIGKITNKIVLRRMGYKYGVTLSKNNNIGKGFLIGHFGRIIINSDAIIGDDFVVSSGVVIGADMRGERKGTPTIGNKVCVHSNSCIVGKVSIGNDVVIAPNTFVNFDVPDHSVVIGNPAVIHKKENATEGYIGTHLLED